LKFRSQLFFIYMSVDFYMVVFEKKNWWIKVI
jgi:hypothetical protein